MKVKIGVEGFTFDSSHYTTGISDKCMSLHGHTFRLDVEVEGEVDEQTGMVVDFSVVKNVVMKVLESWDHSLIVPERDVDKVKLEGPFKRRIKVFKAPAGTTECIAIKLAEEIYNELKLPVKVKVYEGSKSYALVEYP